MIKKFALLFVLVVLSNTTFAQAIMLGFNNKHLIQSNLVNPALRPQYGLAFSINNQITSYWSKVTPADLLDAKVSAYESVKAFVENGDKSLRDIDFENHTNLLTIGYRRRFSYLSFNSAIVEQGNLNVDKNALGMLFLGNGYKDYIGKRVALDFSNSYLRAFWENRITWGLVINDYLTVGVNYSKLKGLYNYELQKATFGITTDTNAKGGYALGLDADMYMRTSGTKNLMPVSAAMLFPGGGVNKGHSFGFGAVYRPNEKWQYSISAINYGIVNWTNSCEYVQISHANYVFTGVDTTNVNKVMANGDLGFLSDSISAHFTPQKGELKNDMSFFTNLHSQWNYGIEYFVTPQNWVSFNFVSGVGASRMKRCWTLQSQNRIKENVDVMLSYSRYNLGDSRHLLGMGVIAYKGNFQIHFLANNLKALMDFDHSHGLMLDVGITFLIGRNVDADNDDVPDYRDECKGLFGRRNYLGCTEDMPGKPYEYEPNGKELRMIEKLNEKQRWKTK